MKIEAQFSAFTYLPVIMIWATGATAAISPSGCSKEVLRRMNAIWPFWKAVSMDTAVICGHFSPHAKASRPPTAYPAMAMMNPARTIVPVIRENKYWVAI